MMNRNAWGRNEMDGRPERERMRDAFESMEPMG
jgi:hypothetical protein